MHECGDVPHYHVTAIMIMPLASRISLTTAHVDLVADRAFGPQKAAAVRQLYFCSTTLIVVIIAGPWPAAVLFL